MTFLFPNKPRRIFEPDALSDTIDLAAWLVQPKWNGHRALPHVDAQGRVVVYSRYGRPLGLAASAFSWLAMVDLPRPWSLDGELLRDGRMVVWDWSMLGGKVCIREPYVNRLKILLRALPRRAGKGSHSIETIETLPATKYRNYMLRRSEPGLEGFVFKRRDATDMWGPHRTGEVASMFKYRF